MLGIGLSVLATDEGAARVPDLPVPALGLALGTFVMFIVLLAITMQFNRD